jgi:hypothetical protein
MEALDGTQQCVCSVIEAGKHGRTSRRLVPCQDLSAQMGLRLGLQYVLVKTSLVRFIIHVPYSKPQPPLHAVYGCMTSGLFTFRIDPLGFGNRTASRRTRYVHMVESSPPGLETRSMAARARTTRFADGIWRNSTDLSRLGIKCLPWSSFGFRLCQKSC